MTKYTLVSLLAALLCACGGNTAIKDGLFGKVTLDGYEGKQVYLKTTDASPVILDSAKVIDGKFSFKFNDSVPQVYKLVLSISADDAYPIMLPVVSEKGQIRVSLGELVLTSGTPLNDSLQDFLLAVSNFTDEAFKQENLDMKQMKSDFGKLVEAAIIQNIKTPVGSYIFRMYGNQLTPEQKILIMSRSGESFK